MPELPDISTLTPVDSRTGDKPTNIPGHVIPGKDLRERLGVGVKKKADAPPEGVAAAPVKTAKSAKPAKKSAPVASPPAIGTEEIAAAVAAGVKTALKKDEPVAAPEPKPSDGLTDAQKRKFAVLERMELLNPETKGKAAQFADAIKKLAAYRTEWEANNKGKKFNLEDGEHDEFKTANDIDYDEDEYVEALADLKAEERSNKAMAPINDKLKAQEAEALAAKKATEMVPKIVAHQKSAAKTFFTAMGEDLAGVVDESGTLKPEEWNKVVVSNPNIEHIARMAQQTELVAGEMKRIASGLSNIDEKNPTPLHVEIWNFAMGEEKKVRELPEESQIVDGKRFATSDEWATMSPQKRAHHWHLSDDDLSLLYAEEMAGKVKKIITDEEEKFKNMAQKRGLLPIEAKTTDSNTAPTRVPATNTNRREHSPAGTIAPRVAPLTNMPGSPTKDLLKRITG